MEEKSDPVDTAAGAAAGDTIQVGEKKAAAVSEVEAAAQTTGTSATDTPLSAAETASSDTVGISKTGENANEGAVTQVVREAQEESNVAVEQDRCAADRELTQSSAQPCPPATTEQTRDETEQAGSSNEQDQTVGSPNQPSSEGHVADATEQPCPTAAESVQSAGKDFTQKSSEGTVKPAETVAGTEPSQEMSAASPAADAQDPHTQSPASTESALHSPADVTTGDKPAAVETSTEQTNEAKSEPQHGDPGAQAASDAARSSPDATLSQVGLISLIR